MSGPRIRWRVECPIHGGIFETEAQPKGAWCSRCGGKALKPVPIGSGTDSGQTVGTKR